MRKMMIQITSGKGPAECCRVVACVQSLMMKQAKQQGIELQVLLPVCINSLVLLSDQKSFQPGEDIVVDHRPDNINPSGLPQHFWLLLT